MSTKIKTPDGWKDVAGGNLTLPEGFIQNVDTGMQPVEDGKVMRISKTAFDALAQRDTNVMYYLDEEHDLIDAKPTCRDTDGNLVKGQKIVELTKTQFDALSTKDPDTYYMINDDNNKVKPWYPHPDWANAVVITGEQVYAGYTAPSDGMIFIDVLPLVSETFVYITINNVRVSRGYRNDNYNMSTSVATPVSAGDIIKSSTKVTAQPASEVTFVPWKA